MNTIIIVFAFMLFLGLSLGGAVLGIYLFALISPFLKDRLKHNPDQDSMIKFLVEVDKNRQVVIERAGNPIRIIEGGVKPEEARNKQREAIAAGNYLFKEVTYNKTMQRLYDLSCKYEDYIYEKTGLYFYVPYFTKPKVIPLPRFRIKPLPGKNVYIPIQENEKGYYTNHVRNALTTWYFIYDGIDIEGTPFEITGSIQYHIDREKVIEALYKTDSWNVLLDQTSRDVIRTIVKKEATIDKVVGRPSQKVWDDNQQSKSVNEEISKKALNALKRLKLGKKHTPLGERLKKETLEDVGIIVSVLLISDFKPQLTEKQMERFLSPVLARQEARGEDLKGTIVSANQDKLVKVHKEGGEVSDKILDADALVRASEGNKIVETLLTSFVQKTQQK